MSSPQTAAIILAAGKGTRMKSDLPKVMHRIAGRTMLRHVLESVAPLAPARTIVVLAPGMDDVAAEAAGALIAIQPQPLGTGHAALAALPELQDLLDADTLDDVLVLFGDTPLLTAPTLAALIAERRRAPAAAVVVLGMRPADPAAYGRLVCDENGILEAIVEAKDATPAQRAIGLCNSGVMAIDAKHLAALLAAIGTDNAKGEYYLTDIVAIARERALPCRALEAPLDELLGINSRADLAAAEMVMQRRLREAAMAGGATLIDPDTVYFNIDTVLGRDVTIGPFVNFGPGVVVADKVEIRAFCDIAGARMASGAIVGPFARLRPGAVIGADAHIGNFVEVKQATIGSGAKANHLSYIGDAEIGAGANIGAGTITCNYDGFSKTLTRIGEGAFIGSNTVLVAPITIGAGAYIAAGSAITSDVGDDALAIGRAQQVDKPGRAKLIRKMKAAEKRARQQKGHG
ncbi:MAG TPA: bifunctional UDP-N-acetylglucosamine diphosphorylase/glucosamine-1-phosphate N-acetyltransferase GlmU [Stellaceae bacterium]|nr:bifunctional UDP-N-acetylglucosamine diphosphorylase/glucosamine-1-phosphate N-acetyltransferase GlmU [Stellaceae bacterium]